jgi:hypothetical protein
MSENRTDNMLNIDLDTLYEKTVQELKAIAKELNLKRVTGLKKQTLIDRIREAASTTDEDGENIQTDGEEVSLQYGGKSHIQTYEDPVQEPGKTLDEAIFAAVGVTLAALVMYTELRVRVVYVIAMVLFGCIGVLAVKAARRQQIRITTAQEQAPVPTAKAEKPADDRAAPAVK